MKLKIIDINHEGLNIGRIEADLYGVSAYKLPAIPRKYRAGIEEVRYDVEDADRMRKPEILNLCRENIEEDMFPDIAGITYGRPRTGSWDMDYYV